MKYYHFYSRRTPQINKVAKFMNKNLNDNYNCDIFNLNIFDFLYNFLQIVIDKNFWIWSYKKQNYYFYYKNNILKTIIRYPDIYKIRIFKKILFLAFELRAHMIKVLVLNKLSKKEPGVILVWNGAYFPHKLLIEFAKDTDFKILYFEIAHFPNRIQVDSHGVNHYSSLPREPEFYLNFQDHRNNYKPTDEKSNQNNFSNDLPQHIAVRKNKLKPDGKVVLKPASYIFVVFQVPSDMQILELSPWIKDMYHFYDIVFEMANRIGNLHFVIKEHPSFKLKIFNNVKKHPRIIFDNWGDTKELIINSDAVLTINSTAGLEGLVLEKKVINLGLANYNIKGLVLHAFSSDQLFYHLTNLKNWTYDENLRVNFLKYYYNKYLISGSYSNLDTLTLDAIISKSIVNFYEKRLGPSIQPSTLASAQSLKADCT